MARKKTRQPGRPAGRDPDSVRNALLDAARKFFTARDFSAVSVRQIAADAGVNAAMVNYYFQDKQGLYTAMILETVAPLLADLKALRDHGTEQPSLRGFIERYIRLIADNAWLPNLIVREVLYGSSGFQETFLKTFARHMGQGLPVLVNNECQAGDLRKDLNPQLAALSLISMAAFPFVAKPVLESGLNLRMDAAFTETLVHHTIRLFYEGAKE